MKVSVIVASICLAIASNANANDPRDAGTLDPSFGTAGQVRLNVSPFNQPVGARLVANDVVVQPDGKIVIAGYAAASSSEWIVVRLNPDGTYDSSFGLGGNGIVYLYTFGNSDNQAFSLALRPDGHILVGGTILDSNNGLDTAVVQQLNADGSTDTTWGSNGAVYFTPPAGDGTRMRAIVLDTVDPYAVGVVYIAGSYTHGSTGNNDFFFGGISADGQTRVSNAFEASLGGNLSDSATSLAVQPGTGNVIVGGFATSASGDVDCAAISTVISTNPVFAEAYVYSTYGVNKVARASFNMGGDNNDFCDAMTLTPSGFLLMGGHGTTASGATNYQSAISALFDNTGQLLTTMRGGLLYTDNYAFTYDGHTGNGHNNTINHVLTSRYDTKFPQFMVAGYGYNSIVDPGTTNDFGIGRLSVQGFLGIQADTSFGAGGIHPGFALIDYSQCGQVACSFDSNDVAQSETFDNQGRLLVVGEADDPNGGTDIAIARFAPFDGLFKNGFDTPGY